MTILYCLAAQARDMRIDWSNIGLLIDASPACMYNLLKNIAFPLKLGHL